MNLRLLLAQGEGQTTEFKKSLNRRKEALEALCAMVNADSARGVVVFGVEPDGTVCGVEQGNLDTAQRTLADAIRDGFDPCLTPELHTEELERKRLLLVTAERCRGVLLHAYDGRAWIREGSQKRQLTLSEIDRIIEPFIPGHGNATIAAAWLVS